MSLLHHVDRHKLQLTVTDDKLVGTVPHRVQMQQDLLCGRVAVGRLARAGRG